MVSHMGKKAVVIRGDGIGPEVVDCMLNVLKQCNLQSEIVLCEAGSEQWDRSGRRDASYIPDDTMSMLEDCDACFKGPTTTLPVPNAPRSVAVTLRQKFDLYANIRPTKIYKRLTPDYSLDCVCFREATEGLYTGIETRITDDAAIAIRKISRRGSRRLLEAAVKWGLDDDKKKMVCITKRNILKVTDGIFWEEAQAAVKNTDMTLSEIYIDNMAQQMVIDTERFDKSVLVSTNLFMDIISELASALVGSIGLIYSANMGDDFAMFEAAHGSAPQFAGQNKVNPTATILSGAWMAGYLGESHIQNAIFEAVDSVINQGDVTTWDIGGQSTTTAMTDEIVRHATKLLHK